MDIDPQWAPVISEVIRWAKDLFASKRQTKLNVDDIICKIDQLSYGNAILLQQQSEILAVVMTELRREKSIIVNRGTINLSSTGLDAETEATNQPMLARESATLNGLSRAPYMIATESLFEGVDIAIAKARLTRPSEREQ